MIFKTTTIPKEEDFFRKTCKLGLSDMSFLLEYGDKHEFIGTLTRANNYDNNLYSIEIDECDTNGRVTLLRGLNAKNATEKALMIDALKNDYGFENIEVITTDKHSLYEVNKS